MDGWSFREIMAAAIGVFLSFNQPPCGGLNAGKFDCDLFFSFSFRCL